MNHYHEILKNWETNLMGDIRNKSERIQQAMRERKFSKMAEEVSDFYDYGLKKFHEHAGVSTDGFREAVYADYYRSVERDLEVFGFTVAYYPEIIVLSQDGVPVAVHKTGLKQPVSLNFYYDSSKSWHQHLEENAKEKLVDLKKRRDVWHFALHEPQRLRDKSFFPGLYSSDADVQKKEKRALKELLRGIKKNPSVAEQELAHVEKGIVDYEQMEKRNSEYSLFYQQKMASIEPVIPVLEKALNEVGIELSHVSSSKDLSIEGLDSEESDRILGFI